MSLVHVRFTVEVTVDEDTSPKAVGKDIEHALNAMDMSGLEEVLYGSFRLTGIQVLSWLEVGT